MKKLFVILSVFVVMALVGAADLKAQSDTLDWSVTVKGCKAVVFLGKHDGTVKVYRSCVSSTDLTISSTAELVATMDASTYRQELSGGDPCSYYMYWVEMEYGSLWRVASRTVHYLRVNSFQPAFSQCSCTKSGDDNTVETAK